ncbi:LuxR C-terminal-related transcriptional regulator [Streptomyces sp. NPDC002306]
MQRRDIDWRWPMVGREEEIKLFDEFMASTTARFFTIRGKAGVGKSRFAEECLKRAIEKGWKGGKATATAAAAFIPLGAIAHLLPADVDMGDPAAGFAKVNELLALRIRQPWILLVDDINLLDVASTMLLQQLAGEGILRIVCTIRDGERMNEVLSACVDDRAGSVVDLAELNRGQVGHLLEIALKGRVGHNAVHELYYRSGGNALYLRELLIGTWKEDAIIDGGGVLDISSGSLAATPLLKELITTRLASAGPNGRDLLELLSLCDPVSLSEARLIYGPEVVLTLEALTLIEVTDDGRRNIVRLAHPLYGETLRQTLPFYRRQDILLKHVERIESYGMRRREDAFHVASWRLAATGTGDPHSLIQAAALARYAHDYRQVVSLLEAVPAEDRTSLTQLLLGEALSNIGEWERSENTLKEACRKAKSDSEITALNLARTFNLFWFAAKTDEAFTANAEAGLRVGSETGARHIRITEGTLFAASGRPDLALPLLSELDTTEDSALEINAWLWGAAMQSAALSATGKVNEACKKARYAYSAHLALERNAAQTHPASQLNSLVLALTEAGNFAEALRVGRQAFADLLSARAPLPRVWTAFNMARAEWLAGHPLAAHTLFAESVALNRMHDHTRGLQLGLSGMAAASAILGNFDNARNELAEAQRNFPMGLLRGEERLGEAWIYACSGDIRKARSVLDEAARSARESGNVTSEMLLLTDIARLGGAKEVLARISELSTICDGELSATRRELVAALSIEDSEMLMNVAGRLAGIGADLLSAEAASYAATILRRRNQPYAAAAATNFAEASAARCGGVSTPLLITMRSMAYLTEREREVALLAMRGTSSKEISSILGLSTRTIDNHLQRVYSKLGIGTRRELADALFPAASGSDRWSTDSLGRMDTR